MVCTAQDSWIRSRSHTGWMHGVHREPVEAKWHEYDFFKPDIASYNWTKSLDRHDETGQDPGHFLSPYPPLRPRNHLNAVYLLFTSFRHYVSQRKSYICPISSLFSPFLTHIKYISRTSQENRPSSPRPLPLPLQGPFDSVYFHVIWSARELHWLTDYGISECVYLRAALRGSSNMSIAWRKLETTALVNKLGLSVTGNPATTGI